MGKGNATGEGKNGGPEDSKGVLKGSKRKREDNTNKLKLTIEDSTVAKREPTTIFVDNIPDYVHYQWLRRIFEQCGYVLKPKVDTRKAYNEKDHTTKQKHQPKGREGEDLDVKQHLTSMKRAEASETDDS
ncbi:hypothetical protein U1Q18_037427 [Sarracenia purpurea var. burkii]